MADVQPFRGARFASPVLDNALCPPYDVISAELGRELRGRGRNAVYLELPEGEGARRYSAAAGTWKKWLADGTLIVDGAPAFYVVEERFRLGGRSRRRRGFLAALGTTARAARAIVPHEKTLSKPKADRLRMLRAVGVNASPIFGVYADTSGAARRALSTAVRGRPIARGSSGGVDYRLWRIDEPKAVDTLRGALSDRAVLIADGHHRYEVSRLHHRATKAPGSDAVLAYLVADEDPGLAVLPTHRVVARPMKERAAELASLTRLGGLRALERALASSKDPYAFGLVEGGYWLGVPRAGGGCRSGLAVEWLGRRLLAPVAPADMSYTPDSSTAAARAGDCSGAAVLVKPFSVAQVRRAAEAVGLLPQKSTYFFPKIAAGLVFRPLQP